MKAVFADTFYFLALLNERDPPTPGPLTHPRRRTSYSSLQNSFWWN